MRIVALTAAAAAAGLLAVTACDVDEPDDGSDQTSASPSGSTGGSLQGAPACDEGISPYAEASDEFDEPVADRWRKYWTGPDDKGDSQSGELFFRPRMVKQRDGKVQLLIENENAELWKREGFPAGTIESKFDVPPPEADRPTCVQVRTKGFAADERTPSGEQNVFSATWLHDRPGTFEKNPNPEIDIMEFFQKDEAHHALHKWPYQTDDADKPEHIKVDNCRTGRADDVRGGEGLVDRCRRKPLGRKDLTQGMHVFGMRSEIETVDGEQVGQLTFYVDGEATWIKQLPADDEYFTTERHVILSTQGNPAGEGRPPFPKIATFDWVHTYH